MAAVPQTGDQPFEVVLNSSGESYLVPADKTILERTRCMTASVGSAVLAKSG